jgi:bacterioferritin
MKTKPDKKQTAVIDALNRARSAEIGAILQYMSQHYELADKDYGSIAADLKLIAIDEMRHAEMLAERILVLGGEPTSEPDARPKKNQKIAELLAFDVAAEEQAIVDYNESLEECRAGKDRVSAAAFEQLIDDEQVHLDHLRNLLEHVQELGAAYLARVAGTPSDTGAPARGFVASRAAGAKKPVA